MPDLDGRIARPPRPPFCRTPRELRRDQSIKWRQKNEAPEGVKEPGRASPPQLALVCHIVKVGISLCARREPFLVVFAGSNSPAAGPFLSDLRLETTGPPAFLPAGKTVRPGWKAARGPQPRLPTVLPPDCRTPGNRTPAARPQVPECQTGKVAVSRAKRAGCSDIQCRPRSVPTGVDQDGTGGDDFDRSSHCWALITTPRNQKTGQAELPRRLSPNQSNWPK